MTLTIRIAKLDDDREEFPFELGWTFEAVTNATTIVNLTNHAYWNLDGLETTVDDQWLRVGANRYMPVDSSCLVTGEVLECSSRPGLADIEFKAKPLREIFAEFGDIDNCFLLHGHDDAGRLRDGMVFAAELRSPKTGRVMEVWTSEPCVQIYTGNFLDPLTQRSYGDRPCYRHGAICFETQRPPNAINWPTYADTVLLRPGQHYKHTTLHRFAVVRD